MPKKALFLDRDGIINVDFGYVYQKEKFVFIDGIFDLVELAQQKDYRVIVVTNQSGIGRGYYTENQFLNLMSWVNEEFLKHRGRIDHVYFCPFHPEKGIGHYRQDSFDRKPNPGMLLKAQKDFDLLLPDSLFVGDNLSDLQAGIAANIGHFFLLNNQDTEPNQDTLQKNTKVTRISQLSEVSQFLCSNM
jgi:D-glycero-D-manno-heptose 1,7-bisphosphate phosphatase